MKSSEMTPSLIDGGAITLACMHAVYRSVNNGANKLSLHLELTDLRVKNLLPFGFPNGWRAAPLLFRLGRPGRLPSSY